MPTFSQATNDTRRGSSDTSAVGETAPKPTAGLFLTTSASTASSDRNSTAGGTGDTMGGRGPTGSTALGRRRQSELSQPPSSPVTTATLTFPARNTTQSSLTVRSRSSATQTHLSNTGGAPTLAPT